MAKTKTKAAPAKAAGKGTKKKAASTPNLGDPAKSYQAIKDLVILLDTDTEKFLVEEVRSAGRRSRGHLQQISKLCKQMRKEIQELSNKRKAKKG